MVTAWPQPDVWRKTLNKLDFLVSIDRQLTADAAYADIVLPGTTMYEIDSYMTYGPLFRIREKVINPIGEARNDFFIMAELASRLGYGHLYPQSEDELLRHALTGSEFSLEDVWSAGGTVQMPTEIMQHKKWEKGLMRPDGKTGFDTPSGKFEIASSVLEEHGYDPLPVYTEPKEGPVSEPELSKKFPLIFNSGSRVTTDFRSQHHGIKSLYKERPEPTVTMNTADADERGISTGDLVEISTKRGKVAIRALVTDDIVRGSIDANMGGGGPVGPEAWQNCNINELTDLHRYDPISGFPVYKALLCDVVKVVKGEGTLSIDSGEYSLSHDIMQKEETPTVYDRIYLDHNATTPLDPEVRAAMLQHMKGSFGNPSSIYAEGKTAHFAVESARRSIAQIINCTARRIVFTGSGSEANNLALKGMAFASRERKNHIITSVIEHPSVLATCNWLEKIGFRLTWLGVDEAGRVRPEDLSSTISEKTCLVSIMTANNETGSIQPVAELANICRKHGVPFHTDATQAVRKVNVDVDDPGVDLMTLSGHKLLGPKGIGALYIRKGIHPDPLIHGGKQEGGLRAGTENVLGIIGLGKAAELAVQRLPRIAGVRVLRDRLERGLKDIVPNGKLNGHVHERLPNTLNMSLPGVRGESLVMAMDQQGVSFSSGSACRSRSPKPSYALLAMGLSEEEAHSSIRLSLGFANTEEEIDRTVSLFEKVLKNAGTAVRFVPCR
jgi:cysteine desulfurase NifS